MRRAVFAIEADEFQRVEYMFPRKSKAELYKLAKATTPPPALLQARVLSVLRYIMSTDLRTDLQHPTTAGDKSHLPRRFFKASYADVRATTRQQLSHVTAGCLSDPPKEVVRLHRVNPVTNQAFAARSTSQLEVSHREANQLLDTPLIGLPRAERVLDDFYEQSNDRKRVTRLGQKEPLTCQTDKLQLLISIAKSCGVDKDKLPFQDLS